MFCSKMKKKRENFDRKWGEEMVTSSPETAAVTFATPVVECRATGCRIPSFELDSICIFILTLSWQMQYI